MTRIRQLVVVLVVFMGCNGQPTKPIPVDPYERWRARNLRDYTIDQRRECYCPGAVEEVRITVRSDTITGIVRISDNEEVPYPYNLHYRTIDSLFGIIRTSSAESLEVRYHDVYGYPEMLGINPHLAPVDGHLIYRTSNLRIP